MLDTTLATTFVPGTNLKGDVAGANWTFLLPSLELDHVLCLGRPSKAAWATLTRLGEVTILGDEEGAQPSSNGNTARHGLDLDAYIKEHSHLPFASADVDLIVVVDRLLEELVESARLQAELRRVLKPQGRLYMEPGGLFNASRTRAISRELLKNFGSADIFWLTPLRGESHSAVPSTQPRVIKYFLDNGLHSPSVTTGSFRSFKRLFKRRRAGNQTGPAKEGAKKIKASSRSQFIPGVRFAANVVLNALQNGERLLLKNAFATRRHGALLGGGAGAASPPQYLCDLASDAGLDITGRQWGVVARGDYSSRKVLFFLFDQDPDRADSISPRYVVKMVRDPQYNVRLENEYRALSVLHDRDVDLAASAPRVAFWGYHNELAIIGETAIEGEPFRARTAHDAGCPYLRAALDWFTTLAAGTAEPDVATSADVSATLNTLFERFREIYHLAPEHDAFLQEQLTAISHNRHAFPLVFQHGDPGPWNAIVTPDEKVAFLDWEAAEIHGMPLWDLFYFARSYSIGAARAQGIHDRLRGFSEQFLSDTALSRLLVDRITHYCERVGLHRSLVEPLFYTCWMHRALKESTRLTAGQLERGHYVNLLRLGIEARDMPTLYRLFISDHADATRGH